MIPWEVLATSAVGGKTFVLSRRGEDLMVRVDGQVLMTSRMQSSEIALAEQGLAAHPAPRAILVGGLGLGYTLRAVLDRAAPDAAVTVAELVPALVDAHRTVLAERTGHALADARVSAAVGDVMTELRPATWDVILLDVDNGPEALAQTSNDRLYGDAGIRRCHAALRPRGVLVVWSAGPSDPYLRRLARNGFAAEAVRVPARAGGKASHVLFVAKKR